MTYTGGRAIHDADAHVMEPPDWLRTYADPAWREQMPLVFTESLAPGEGEPGEMDRYRARQSDAPYRADDAAQIMLRKNFFAIGAFLADDRAAAVDLLGVASQLVFNTFTNNHLRAAEHRDVRLAAAMARAHNRGIVEFCSVDQRLLPVAYVPLADRAEAAVIAREAVDAGAAALMIASACPPTHSPSHVELDPVWAIAQDVGVPVVLHVGGGGQLLSPMFMENGLPPVPDFHGGAENFRSVDYLAIPYCCSRATSSAARCASRPTRTRTPAGSCSRPGLSCACSRPTTHTSRAAATRSVDSTPASPAWTTTPVAASTSTTSSTSWADVLVRHGLPTHLPPTASALAAAH